MPLILGFFLIALMFVGAAVMASDAFTRQRDLQSVCDGAATAAANAIDFAAARDGGLDTAALPLGQLQPAVQQYLARDPGRAAVTVSARPSPDARQVTVTCSTRSRLAFGSLFGAGEVTQHASSTARSPLQ